MALPEKEWLGEGEFELNTLVDDGTVFFVYCTGCKKTLYCAKENTEITREVARTTRYGHSESFHPPHHVIKLNRENDKID